jgi:hypothetical protein
MTCSKTAFTALRASSESPREPRRIEIAGAHLCELNSTWPSPLLIVRSQLGEPLGQKASSVSPRKGGVSALGGSSSTEEVGCSTFGVFRQALQGHRALRLCAIASGEGNLPRSGCTARYLSPSRSAAGFRLRWNLLLHRTAKSGGCKESSAQCHSAGLRSGSIASHWQPGLRLRRSCRGEVWHLLPWLRLKKGGIDDRRNTKMRVTWIMTEALNVHRQGDRHD